ncbi:hypothetical protein CYMTET_46878 [Cymbomonas tetramitiformis]|uniref:Uncharacterized protein n=1 Tax=Cymbomonas tetramitiformis TaxID=36881 RepID=A0AAE0BWN2_9CHLO|nr:hypothetical protein CYMTET_46878 [Cymbomonas tetramitiformis]
MTETKQRVEAAKAAAKARAQKQKADRELAVQRAQASGSRGVYLLEDTRLIDISQEQLKNQLAAPLPLETVAVASRKVDKRELTLETLRQVQASEEDGVISLTLCSDGFRVIAGLESKVLVSWSADKVLQLTPALSSAARQLRLSADETRVEFVLDDGVFGVTSSAELQEPRLQPASKELEERARRSYEVPAAKWSRSRNGLSCRAVAMMTDHSQIFVGSPLFEDYSIFVWCPSKESSPVALRGHTDKVTALQLSNNGAVLWSGGHLAVPTTALSSAWKLEIWLGH